MGTPVIRVAGIAKRYHIGLHRRHRTLREAAAAALATPFRGRVRAGSTQQDTVWALRDVSFDVHQGEVVGIIGRNGAGKSTLLKILSKITRPSVGRIEIRGRVGALLEVGTGFNRELTGRENIFLNGVILGMRAEEINSKLDEIVAFAGIERFLDTPVKHYSTGMYVRLAFSVAAHLRPEILLVDEVLAVGDIEFQRKCIGRMEQVARDGRTVLLVSHHLGTVRALCQRVLLLEGGRLERLGPPTDVIEQYLGNHAVASADQTIAAADHAGGVREIRLMRVTLLNGLAGRFVVHWNESIRLRFEIEVQVLLDDVSFGTGIRTVDGVSVFTVHQDDGGGERWRLSPGHYAVELELDNTLRPGLHRLHVGADQGGLAIRNILSVESVHIEVLGYGRDGAVPAASNTGYVNGHSVWRAPQAVSSVVSVL